jgi:hypothetical protein
MQPMRPSSNAHHPGELRVERSDELRKRHDFRIVLRGHGFNSYGLKLRTMKLPGTYDFERALGLIADAKCAS